MNWLLLVHQIPTTPSSARVRIWRRLQALGAVPLRSSAYVLPNTPEQREDVEWVRAEIMELGGHSTVFVADTIDDQATEDIENAFRSARAADYQRLQQKAAHVLKAASGPRSPGKRARLAREVRQAATEWQAVNAITFFDTPKRMEVAHMLEEIERHLHGQNEPRPSETETPDARLDAATFVGRTWVTRPRPGIDRMASGWLIRRHIDPEARFAFSDRPSPRHIPFDTFGAVFGHHGDRCTYETLAHRFGIEDAAVSWIGRIVHDLDLKDSRFGLPETVGVGRFVEGLRQQYADDDELLTHGMALIESLARSFTEDRLPAPTPPGGRTKRRTRRAAASGAPKARRTKPPHPK